MKDFFKELFEYTTFYNQQLVEIFCQHPEKVSDKSQKLLSHILNAHHIWNNRIQQKRPMFAVWEQHPVSALMDIEFNNFHTSMTILDSYDFHDIFSYANSTGQKFENSIRDILFHIVNHTTYHRGQIASDFRLNGLEPIISDFIKYKR